MGIKQTITMGGSAPLTAANTRVWITSKGEITWLQMFEMTYPLHS